MLGACDGRNDQVIIIYGGVYFLGANLSIQAF